MKTLTITRDQYQDLEDAYADAMSDRNVLLLRSIKVELDEMIDDAHAEALNEWIDRDLAAAQVRIDALVEGGDRLREVDRQLRKEVEEVAEERQLDEWANSNDSRKTMAQWIEVDHAEALEINAEFDIAGVNAARLQSQFYAAYDYSRRREIVEAAHSEALGINQCFDFRVQQSELAAEQQRAVLERLA